VTPTTVPDALAAALRGDAAAPFVTWIGADGARSELSLRTYENNVAKAANLLRDDADLGPGGTLALHLPVHWQTGVWLGACALVGATAVIGGDPAQADVSVVGPAELDLPRAPLALATSLHPFGLPFAAALPSGLLDVATEVRAHGDRFASYGDVTAATTWLASGERSWTHLEALEEARAAADRLGLGENGRLLVVATELDATTVLALVAVPLAVRGSVVLLTDGAASTEQVAEAERCEAVLLGG
jgi:uncharacterized protein (TIGR03089 family)